MKLGFNLSRELLKLREEGITTDYVKTLLLQSSDIPYVDDKLFEFSMLHGVGKDIEQRTGALMNEYPDFRLINENIRKSKSPHYTIHCSVSNSDFEGEISIEDVKKRMDKNIKMWKKGLEVNLLIENVPFTRSYGFEKGVLDFSVNPKLIRELCIENDIGLCLDIAHAKVTAKDAGMEVIEYIKMLPYERIKEIHITGTKLEKGEVRDGHLECQEEDYEILKKTLEIVRPEYISVEYGGMEERFRDRSDIDAIRRQIVRIRQISKDVMRR